MLGFIGAGNMGGAIIGGAVSSGAYNASDIIAADKNEFALEKIKNQWGVQVTDDNKKAAECDILVLGIKPQFLYNVIEEIKDCINDNTIVVSIVAGQSVEKINSAFGRKMKLVRVMPNTPALVGESMSALSPSDNVSDDELKKVLFIFEKLGKAEVVSENLMEAVTAVSGSAPAYVFMFIEAMADAAVEAGMPRKQAYVFAAQAVLGSAKMVLETGMHPGELKDMVCSPGGTTIEAVRVLEEKGMRAAVMDAMKACVEKSRKL